MGRDLLSEFARLPLELVGSGVRVLAFGRRYEQVATPFEWKFTRADLDRLAQRLDLPVAQAA